MLQWAIGNSCKLASPLSDYKDYLHELWHILLSMANLKKKILWPKNQNLCGWDLVHIFFIIIDFFCGVCFSLTRNRTFDWIVNFGASVRFLSLCFHAYHSPIGIPIERFGIWSTKDGFIWCIFRTTCGHAHQVYQLGRVTGVGRYIVRKSTGRDLFLVTCSTSGCRRPCITTGCFVARYIDDIGLLSSHQTWSLELTRNEDRKQLDHQAQADQTDSEWHDWIVKDWWDVNGSKCG